MNSESVSDHRIRRVRPLVSPAALVADHPLSDAARDVVVRGRDEVVAILDGLDDRLLVIVGPCSIHDPAAAMDYAARLADLAATVDDALCVVMRVYFEKPRTTVGWKGLINDPGLDGRFEVNDGLRLARSLILRILDRGLPVGCEFLDPITPQYLADAVSWAAIGARTAHSQIHRQLSSGLSMPVGIKNPPDGDVQGAVDAVLAAASSHVFAGIDAEGRAALFTTAGNRDGHVVLRGGSSSGPNYDVDSIDDARRRLAHAGLPERIVVDASHANSGKRHERQLDVVSELASRRADGDRRVNGVMVESFLEPGRQDLELGRRDRLRYGQSVTDACIGWDDTVAVLERLAAGVRAGAGELVR